MGTKMYFIQEGIVDIVMSNGEVITMIFFFLYGLRNLARARCCSLRIVLIEVRNCILRRTM